MTRKRPSTMPYPNNQPLERSPSPMPLRRRSSITVTEVKTSHHEIFFRQNSRQQETSWKHRDADPGFEQVRQTSLPCRYSLWVETFGAPPGALTCAQCVFCPRLDPPCGILVPRRKSFQQFQPEPFHIHLQVGVKQARQALGRSMVCKKK